MYEISLIGIENMMDAFYNNKLHWANGLTQEYLRLVLPLVFLNTLTWPASVPLSSLLTAPIATMFPLEDIDTDLPELSPAFSPSISEPI